MKKPLALLVLFTAVSFALSACGGGGGSSSDASSKDTAASSNSANTPTATRQSMGTLAQPTYTGKVLEAFNLLNSFRTTCGFGGLQQNTKLDQAASNHAEWMKAHNVQSDIESTNLTDKWTGYDNSARARYVGYPMPSSTGDGFVWGSINGAKSAVSSGEPPDPVLLETYGLLGAPYHFASLFTQQANDFGVGYTLRKIDNDQSYFRATEIIVAYQPDQANADFAQGTGGVVTFPCQGIEGLYATGSAEVPYPTVDGAPIGTEDSPGSGNYYFGTPIYVAGNSAQTLKVTRNGTTVTEVGGNGVDIVILDQDTETTLESNGPNLYRHMKRHHAVIIPKVKLKAQTSYAVSIVGTIDGVAFTRSFTFRTGLLGS